MGAARDKFTERLAKQLATFGWPEVMSLTVAERYTCKSRWTIRRAVAAGQLRVAGRRSGRLCFSKDDLNAWMLGEPMGSEQ